MNTKTLISGEPLSLDEAFSFVNDAKYGGNCLFVGTVRSVTMDQVTTALEFESFESMALKEMQKIASAIMEKHGPAKVFMSHRTGHAEPGDVVVIIAVATAHRKAAFEACQYGIDTLKDTVPIWKKEILEDGSYWVNARP